jgi:hypothetical protein
MPPKKVAALKPTRKRFVVGDRVYCYFLENAADPENSYRKMYVPSFSSAATFSSCAPLFLRTCPLYT